MQQGEQRGYSVVDVQLRDGRIVNVRSKSGANAFLEAGAESQALLSSKVERMSSIFNKRRLKEKDKKDLMAMHILFGSVSLYGSQNLFRVYFEQSTIKAWLKCAIQQIKRITKNRDWIETGELPTHDTYLLTSCIGMMYQAMPVSLAFRETEFFNVLADFVKARKGNGRALPCVNICDVIARIITNAYSITRCFFDNPWTEEKALKKLEATGVLEQFIRCVTVPQENDYPLLLRMLEQFQECVPFIRKKLLPGQPCGDVLLAILEGRDGSRVERPSVLNKLKTMNRFATSLDPKQKRRDGIHSCRKCNKADPSESFQESLMKCARCQLAYYCSKECQKADWKTHKKKCFAITSKKELAFTENISQTLQHFCDRQYAHIMVKMVQVCEQTGHSKNDMLVELDFRSNEKGVVPAMQDKPELTIVSVKDYLEGSTLGVNKRFSKYMPENSKEWYLTIKEKYQRMQSNQILLVTNFPGSRTSQLYSSFDPISNKEAFSQEAVIAFKAYMDNGDDRPLSAIFQPGNLRKYKRELSIHYGYGVLDE